MSAFNLDPDTFHHQLRNLLANDESDETFSDARIKCSEDGGVVAANQLILASCSKVFRHVLTRANGAERKGRVQQVSVALADKIESGETYKTFKVKGVSSKAMRNVVSFMNRGSISFGLNDDSAMEEFVDAAVALKVKGITRERDDIDLDLSEAATPPIVCGSAKDDDTNDLLFDNEAALSEAVTQERNSPIRT
jgi:hypothetical protein